MTAAHVIDGIAEHGDDGKVWVRFNLSDGGVGEAPFEVSAWKRHPDRAKDVAAMGIVTEGVKRAVLMMDDAALRAKLEELEVSLGDDIFMIGLFTGHHGRERNTPIVRVGNLASMPTEAVRAGSGEVVAYLIEARSSGGLSGSPVFLHLGQSRVVKGQLARSVTPEGMIYLLGVMHGHWDGEVVAPQLRVVERDRFNMGIGVVMPIDYVAELLEDPEFVEGRRQASEEAD